MVQTLKIQTHS